MRPFSRETRERVLGSPEAVAAHKAARGRLERVGEADRKTGRDWETDEYLDANSAVIETEKHVPWWRR